MSDTGCLPIPKGKDSLEPLLNRHIRPPGQSCARRASLLDNEFVAHIAIDVLRG